MNHNEIGEFESYVQKLRINSTGLTMLEIEGIDPENISLEEAKIEVDRLQLAVGID